MSDFAVSFANLLRARFPYIYVGTCYRLKLSMDVMIKIGPYVSVISTSTRPGGGSAPKTGGRIVDV